MRKIIKSIDIRASREAVWAAVINDAKYRLWASAFGEGSYFEGGWQEGDTIRFLALDEEGRRMGMVSQIVVSDHLKDISIRHQGLISDGAEDYTSEDALKWAPAYENYHLEAIDGQTTRFTVDAEITEEYYDMFDELWSVALEKLKAVCEENQAAFLPVTISAEISAPIERVWEYWNGPEHVVKWKAASDDWHCPRAQNDLRPGGRFVFSMAARDGSAAFDFSGTYIDVVPGERIVSQLDDGRMTHTTFKAVGPSVTRVEETFEAEMENPPEMQRAGWQAILDNFKRVVESA